MVERDLPAHWAKSEIGAERGWSQRARRSRSTNCLLQ